MRGVWLTAFARRITRRDTFDSLVAPALADLQYEAVSGRPIAPHYVALVIVISTALLRDLRLDAQLTFGAARVWRRVAAWYGAFVICYVALVLYLDTPWHLLDATGQATALANALAIGLMAALPTAAVAAAFHLRRESIAPRRDITIAAMAFVAAAVALQITAASVSPTVNRMLFESVSRGVAQQRPGAGLDDRRQYPGHWKSWLETKRERSAPAPSKLAAGVGSFAVGMTFSSILNLIPYVMFGVALARGRRWTVLLRVLGLVVTYMALQVFIIALGIPVLTGGSRGHDAVRQLVVMFVTAIVWLCVFRGSSSAVHHLNNRSA
jgi:hypothetical protein